MARGSGRCSKPTAPSLYCAPVEAGRAVARSELDERVRSRVHAGPRPHAEVECVRLSVTSLDQETAGNPVGHAERFRPRLQSPQFGGSHRARTWKRPSRRSTPIQAPCKDAPSEVRAYSGAVMPNKAPASVCCRTRASRNRYWASASCASSRIPRRRNAWASW